jgi:hypothetical protein
LNTEHKHKKTTTKQPSYILISEKKNDTKKPAKLQQTIDCIDRIIVDAHGVNNYLFTTLHIFLATQYFIPSTP